MPRTTSTSTTRRSPLTGRAAVLALVLAALVISSVVPLRAYFSQRADLAELRARTAAQEKRVEALKAVKQKWEDPAYVEAQARSRLHFVMPGETGYVVLGPEEAPAPSKKKAVVASGNDAWFAKLWDSVEEADRPDAAEVNAPSAASR